MLGDDFDEAVKGHHPLFNVRLVHEDVELARQVGQLQLRKGQENFSLEILKCIVVLPNLRRKEEEEGEEERRRREKRKGGGGRRGKEEGKEKREGGEERRRRR